MTTSNEDPFARIMRDTSREMRAAFEKARSFQHRGEKGVVREHQFADFLEQYVPRTLAVTRGAEVISTGGERSPQCDVVLHDPGAPAFLRAGGYSLLPVEVVYGVVEVKSNLTTGELADAWEKIGRLKQMEKVAYAEGPPTPTFTWDGVTRPYMPLSGMIFGYEGAEITTLGEKFRDLAADTESHLCPDAVFVLGKGSIQWTNPENRNIDGYPSRGSGILVLADLSDSVLLNLVLQLHNMFGAAWTPPLDLRRYTPTASLGAVQIHYEPDPEPEDESGTN